MRRGRGRLGFVAAVLTAVVGCGPGGSGPAPGTSAEGGEGSAAAVPGTSAAHASDGASVWSVDLIRTFPGRQDEFLGSIEANWGSARILAVRRGAVRSYRAFAAEPDSARGWDVLLMTEYADSAAYADREAIFQEIFASPEFTFSPMSAPSDEIRAFFAPETAMRSIVVGGAGE